MSCINILLVLNLNILNNIVLFKWLSCDCSHGARNCSSECSRWSFHSVCYASRKCILPVIALISNCCTYTWDPTEYMGKLVCLTQLKFHLYWKHTTLIQFNVSSPLISSTKNAHCDRRRNKDHNNLSANWLLQIDVTLYTWFTFHYCSVFFLNAHSSLWQVPF